MAEVSTPDSGVTEPTAITEDQAAAQIEALFNKKPQEDSQVEDESPVENEPEEEEQEPEQESDEENPDGDLVELDVDGETWQVPKKLQEGYLRHKDYTQKTQEVAVKRAEVEQEKQTLEAQKRALAEYVQLANSNVDIVAELKAIDSRLVQYQELDWNELVDSDPVEAIKLDRQMRDLMQLKTNVQERWGQTQEQLRQHQQSEMTKMLQSGIEVLKRDIPNWSEDTAKSIRTFGTDTYGFSQDELAQIVDPRVVKVLHDAMQYRQLKASKPEVEKRVSAPQKTVKPGSSTTQKTQAAANEARLKANLSKSGKLDDAAALLYAKMTRKK